MHTNQTYNSLTIDSPDFKFPAEMQGYLKDYDWSGTVWNSFGLPAFQSSFSLTGDQLYFEGDANGKINLRQSDFTGQILASCVVTPENCESIFVVTFELAFCMGKLCNYQLAEFKTSPRNEYDIGFQNHKVGIEKSLRMQQSLWFKYLYRPYFYVVKGITVAISFTLNIITEIIIWFAQLITPIKL